MNCKYCNHGMNQQEKSLIPNDYTVSYICTNCLAVFEEYKDSQGKKFPEKNLWWNPVTGKYEPGSSEGKK